MIKIKCSLEDSLLWMEGINLVRGILRQLEDCFFGDECRLLDLRAHDLREEKCLREYVIFDERKAKLGRLAYLFHLIPVHILDVKSKNRDEGAGIIDQLGAYFPSNANDEPYIEIYSSEIRHVAPDDRHYIWLFAKVLLHELAHALLDIRNYDCWEKKTNKIPYFTTFGRWREESMANAIALKIIHEYGDEPFYEYSKKFVQAQSGEYSLGALIEDFADCDWVIEDKLRGVDPVLQQKWLDFVSNTPDVKGLEEWNSRLFRNYVYELNGDYYTFAPRLIAKVVNTVIAEYYAKFGERISVNKLRQIFPNVSGQCVISKQDVCKYSEKLDLLEGEFYLCQSDWRDDSVSKYLERYLKESGSTLIKYTKGAL